MVKKDGFQSCSKETDATLKQVGGGGEVRFVVLSTWYGAKQPKPWQLNCAMNSVPMGQIIAQVGYRKAASKVWVLASPPSLRIQLQSSRPSWMKDWVTEHNQLNTIPFPTGSVSTDSLIQGQEIFKNITREKIQKILFSHVL